MSGSNLSLKARALRYLASREHSRVELERKLRPHAAQPQELALLLDELQQRDLQSENRVVESLLHRRAKGLGAARLRQELKQKGIAEDSMEQALQGLQATEMERAQQVWAKKFGAEAKDAKEHSRQMRFLLSRGFSAEIVRRVLREAGDAET